MKKLKEIDRLVEEAYEKLADSDTHEENKRILTSLARKCAEINKEDWCDSGGMPCNAIKDYNARLDYGQVETPETKQEEKPDLQPLPDEVPEWFITSWTQSVGGLHMRIEEWKKVIKHFGIKPPEWWQNLKKGDKFMFNDGIEDEIRTYNDHYSCIHGDYFLYSTEKGDGIGYGVDNCTPYTDPTQSFREKLTPEMQVEFDKLMEGVGK